MELKVLRSGPAYHVSWSPTEPLLAYILSTERAFGVSVIRPDGEGRRDLVTEGAMYIEWSPEGTEIAFWGFSPHQSGLNVVNSKSLQVQCLYPIQSVYEIKWSPDGRYIAFYGSEASTYKLVIVARNSGEVMYERLGRTNHLAWDRGAHSLFYDDQSGEYAYYLSTKKEVAVQSSAFSWSARSHQYLRLANQELLDGKFDNVSSQTWSLDGTKLLFTANTPLADQGRWNLLKPIANTTLTLGLFYVDLGKSRAMLVEKQGPHENFIHGPVLSHGNSMIALTRSQNDHQINIISL